MTIKQMESAALGVIESKDLAEPTFQKGSLRRIMGFLRTTRKFMNGDEVALPSDKDRFKAAYEEYIGRKASHGEPTVINILYRLQ